MGAGTRRAPSDAHAAGPGATLGTSSSGTSEFAERSPLLLGSSLWLSLLWAGLFGGLPALPLSIPSSRLLSTVLCSHHIPTRCAPVTPAALGFLGLPLLPPPSQGPGRFLRDFDFIAAHIPPVSCVGAQASCWLIPSLSLEGPASEAPSISPALAPTWHLPHLGPLTLGFPWGKEGGARQTRLLQGTLYSVYPLSTPPSWLEKHQV